MNTTAQIKQTSKPISQFKKSVQQMAQEPLEILKTAQSQVSGKEVGSSVDEIGVPQANEGTTSQQTEQRKTDVAISDNRNLESLQNEMREIRRQKLFNSLLARIQGGEDVPVEEFQELSHEQRDVLKAQLEAYKKRSAQQSIQKPLVEPSTKRGRGLAGFGKRKTMAEKQQTRVEMPLPPSG
ncbi:hypothetical protein ISR94_00385 [Candidatus Microgenomates bacterium]|nr:hypothetical protein [Candidatus Microgenomates bacterium]